MQSSQICFLETTEWCQRRPTKDSERPTALNGGRFVATFSPWHLTSVRHVYFLALDMGRLNLHVFWFVGHRNASPRSHKQTLTPNSGVQGAAAPAFEYISRPRVCQAPGLAALGGWCSGKEGMNLGIPFKKTTSWMVYGGHSVSHSLLSNSKKTINILCLLRFVQARKRMPNRTPAENAQIRARSGDARVQAVWLTGSSNPPKSKQVV